MVLKAHLTPPNKNGHLIERREDIIFSSFFKAGF
jgi:hypothetical protein